MLYLKPYIIESYSGYSPPFYRENKTIPLNFIIKIDENNLQQMNTEINNTVLYIFQNIVEDLKKDYECVTS